MIPITDRNLDYVYQAAEKMNAAGLRVKVDDSSDRMGAKIRDAEKLKIPYMLVVGDREQEAATVAPRLHSGAQLDPLSIDELIELMQGEVKTHAKV